LLYNAPKPPKSAPPIICGTILFLLSSPGSTLPKTGKWVGGELKPVVHCYVSTFLLFSLFFLENGEGKVFLDVFFLLLLQRPMAVRNNHWGMFFVGFFLFSFCGFFPLFFFFLFVQISRPMQAPPRNADFSIN